jgi:hypothetical protein
MPKVLAKNPGMNTSNKKKVSPSSKDPIDILIFEKGLRIKTLFIEKELDLLLVILNNGNLIKSRISVFDKLSNASQEDLLLWELRNEGAGIRWISLDEDLSLYGFLMEATSNAAVDQLLKKNSFVVIS